MVKPQWNTDAEALTHDAFGEIRAMCIQRLEAKDIADGKQTLIAKGWPTHHRGRLLIVGVEKVLSPHSDHVRRYGTACCIVEITGCRDMRPGDEKAAGFGYRDYMQVWEFSNVRKVDPVEVPADQMIYDVDVSPLNGGRQPQPAQSPVQVLVPPPEPSPRPLLKAALAPTMDAQPPAARPARRKEKVAEPAEPSLFG